MTPDDTILAPGTPAQTTDPEPGRPPVAAPARAVKLVPKPVLPPVQRTPLPAASSFSRPAPMPEREKRSALERKLAGMYDATEMLKVLETEMVLQRAKRLSGAGSRQGLRVAAIALFFTLLVAAMGAMFYLQSQLAGKGFSRHRSDPATMANPVPAASAPAVAPTPPPAGARR